MYKLQTYTIILLFGQQTEPPRSLSRSKNFHVNRKKKKENYPPRSLREKK